MYIPYRKAYLTGMSPLSFITFFAIGELGMITALAIVYTGGIHSLWQQLVLSQGVLFWLVLGGVMWVIGDIFQQYAAKYIGISRGIPLSNTNQLWGLLWGILVFAELRGASRTIHFEVIGGSVLMALGAGAVAASSATEKEHSRWKDAAQRETLRYNLDQDYVLARMAGEAGARQKRTLLDWLLAGVSTAVILAFALMAEIPRAEPHWGAMAALLAAMFVLLAISGLALWRATRFT
jgi:hypothetical protein